MPTPNRFLSLGTLLCLAALFTVPAATTGCLVIQPSAPSGTPTAEAPPDSTPANDRTVTLDPHRAGIAEETPMEVRPSSGDDIARHTDDQPLRPTDGGVEGSLAPATSSFKADLRPAIANTSDAMATSGDDAKKDPAEALRAKRRKLASTRRKLELAQLEQEDAKRTSQQGLRQKEAALQNSMAKLTAFVEAEQPNRIQKSEVDLESTENRHQDAVDELAQLEMMYKDSELEERTSEIVLNRGRRQLEVARKRLDIQRAGHQLLIQHQLPLEKRELELKVSAAEQGVESSRRQTRISEMKKTMAILELEEQTSDLERDIEKLEKNEGADKDGATKPQGSL